MKVKKNEFIFYIGIIILSLKSFFSASMLININNFESNVLLIVSYICFLSSFFMSGFNFRMMIGSFLLVSVGCLTYIFSKYTGFMTLTLLFISIRNIDIKSVIKILFIINLIMLILHICLYIVYLLFDVESLNFLVRNQNGIKVIRYSFFFKHPNVFGIYVFWTIAMYYYLYWEKLNISSYVITFLTAILMYIFPNSKTSAIVLITMVGITILKKKDVKLFSIKKLYFFISLFLILSMIFIDNPVVMKLNKLLTGRIVLGRVIFNAYGISLFGVNISNEIKNTVINGQYYTNINIIDSTYYSLLLNYGIVAFLIFSYFIFSYRSNIEKKEEVFIILLLLYGISETKCLSPEIAFPLMFLSRGVLNKLWIRK